MGAQPTKPDHYHPPTDVGLVVEEEIREWHFHIYFLQGNSDQSEAALALRDAVLRLRRGGAFIAVPLNRVNEDPVGPHPVGSYEIWVPSESFASVYSYICQHRGELSVLVHPLTREKGWKLGFVQRKDHESRHAWMGHAFPLNLDTLSAESEEIPLQYPLLKLGYSSPLNPPTLEEREAAGKKVEETLREEEGAEPTPEY